MSRQARIGQWLVFAVIILLALLEAATDFMKFQAGQFERAEQVGAAIPRVLITGLILWRLWCGSAWARWLLALCSLAGTALAAFLALSTPSIQGRPELVALFGGFVVVGLLTTIALASPWVGAYQAARRGSPHDG